MLTIKNMEGESQYQHFSAIQKRKICKNNAGNNNLIMLRLLAGKGSSIRFNYLKSHKKPVVEIPTTVPPKYIYQVVYHPKSMPDFDMKFPDHEHFDEWKNIYYGEEDKFEFQYSGQWWDTISVTGRASILIGLITFILVLYESAEERKRKHLPGFLSYYRVGDISTNHLPTQIES